MESNDRDWMQCKKNDPKYRVGVRRFLDFAFSHYNKSEVVPCPCVKCNNERRKSRPEIEFDLLKFGIVKSYTRWLRHGESFECKIGKKSHQQPDHHSMREMLHEAFGMMPREVKLGYGDDIDAGVKDGSGGDPTEEAKNEATEAKKEAIEANEENKTLKTRVEGLEKECRATRRALEYFMNAFGYNLTDLKMDELIDEEPADEPNEESDKIQNKVEDFGEE